MSTVIELSPGDIAEERAPTDGLFVVWFDLHCGRPPADWWWEVPGPQPLPAALDAAAEMRADGWICKVVPEGQNPRPDGRWDNP
jgi:hypothetical protein